MTQPAPSCEERERTEDGGEECAEAELERAQRLLQEQEGHAAALEGQLIQGAARIHDLERQVVSWREKYDRLYDSHKRVQRVNQGLEDKLLQMAERCSSDKAQLARDVETLSVRLAESNHTMGGLHKENERYKNDMTLAIRLLQCKPDNFVSQKFDTLPIETQARVSSYIMSKAKQNHEPAVTGAPRTGPTTPEKIDPDEFEFNISASLMSKILEESVQNTISKHCNTCTCPKRSANPFSYGESHYTVSTQTALMLDASCPHCAAGQGASSPTRETVLFLQEDPPSYVSPPTSTIEGNTNNITEITKDSLLDSKMVLPLNEDSTSIVSMKHKEIMEKIGENLNEMNLKNEFQMSSMEPSGHHRLCARTKPASGSAKSPVEYYYPKPDDGPEKLHLEMCKPVAPSPNLVSTIQMAEDLDITFAQIESPVAIPNIAECKINYGPQIKADLNYMETPNNFRNNSISSNEAESKTSSSRSWKNNGSHNSSNAKVHIGPGPRFCSLRMQAGSKNILLDNAQPNIAPVLYTRQARNLETSPSTLGALCDDDMPLPEKHTSRQLAPGPYGPSFVGSSGTNVFSNISLTEEIAILDLPNEELPLRPIDICEKPESGYKSNESAEIIDKLLFGVDPTVPGTPVPDPPQLQMYGEMPKDKLGNVSETNEIKMNISSAQINDVIQNPGPCMRERRVSINNMKVFNFDQYERNLKVQPMGKIIKDKMMPPPFGTYGSTKVPGTARQVITDLGNISKDVAQAIGGDLNKMAQQTVNQFTKKLVRNIANQTLPDNLTGDMVKDWKKEASTEKSSSSLSSDDSAAVLQKQQLLRVAQWVQQNLELEQQEPAEELHHVRNDFPRPAKVEHARRRPAHRRHARPEDSAALSREELARMEYNVKQFLLNGSRWTDSPGDRRTASKTETDL